MKRLPLLFTLALVFLVAGCSRNGEYTYLSELHLLEPVNTLLPKIRHRLMTSEFRKHYDQTLPDRIGSSFKDFKHIRAYQNVLEDALVYLMLKTGIRHFSDDIRGQIVRPVSKLILSNKSGEQLIEGLDHIAGILHSKTGPDLSQALANYDHWLAQEK